MMAGVNKVSGEYIHNINEALAEYDYALVPFNDFIVFTSEADCRHHRKLPGRLLEKYLPEEVAEEPAGDDDIELDDDAGDFPS